MAGACAPQVEAAQAELAAEVARDEAAGAALEDRIEALTAQLRDASADRSESQRNRKLAEALEKLQATLGADRVLGRLLSLCSPTSSKYNLAVTVIMGKHMESVVVDSAATARECIDLLRETRAGVATFIPLDAVKVKPLDARLRGLSSTSRLARDIIRAERPGVQRAIDFAVENAVVCDTEDEAKELCYGSQVAEKAVALNGTVIKRSGAMTGGNQSGGKVPRCHKPLKLTSHGALAGLTHFAPFLCSCPQAHMWEEKKVDAVKKELAECKLQRADQRATKKKADQLKQLATDLSGYETRLGFLTPDTQMAAENLAKARLILTFPRAHAGDGGGVSGFGSPGAHLILPPWGAGGQVDRELQVLAKALVDKRKQHEQLARAWGRVTVPVVAMVGARPTTDPPIRRGAGRAGRRDGAAAGERGQGDGPRLPRLLQGHWREDDPRVRRNDARCAPPAAAGARAAHGAPGQTDGLARV